MQTVRRHIRTPETKPFFTTSEFWVWLITIICIVVAGAVVGNGDHHDVLRANLVWILFTAVSISYIVSRGISKAGTKYRERGQDGRGY
jgi:CBS domain-containing protein